MSQIKESDTKITLNTDYSLLQDATYKLTLHDGTQKTLYRVPSTLVGQFIYIERDSEQDDKCALERLSTHYACSSCGKVLLKNNSCVDCSYKIGQARVQGYKDKAKLVLTDFPETGIWCEEKDRFYWDLDSLIDDFFCDSDEVTIDFGQYSFFGLRKENRGINLEEHIYEGASDDSEFELDREGLELEDKLNTYIEKKALLTPDYTVWFQMDKVLHRDD